MGIRSDLLAATRRTLCETALQLFVEQGIAATKMEDILKASDVSVGSFYYLFKNKIDLASILYVETQEQFFQSLLKDIPHLKEAREGIETLIRAYLHWAADHPTKMYYLAYRHESEIIEVAQERDKLSQTDFFAQLQTWLQPFIDRGEIRPLPAVQCFALWLGPTDYLVRDTLSTFGPFFNIAEPSLREHLLASTEVLAEAAWQALKI
ncbi:MAG: TetR/AcrR family transcriptional regulator [Chloroflexi bacterium]|nr:TetR/AcrR family transcriptional regulator [Chloroflexota bacterium]